MSTWVHRTPAGVTASSAIDGSRRAYRQPGTWGIFVALASNAWRSRYRGQRLGPLWSFLYPLAMMGLLSSIFRYVSRIDMPHYPTFVLIGVVFWHYITRAWTSSTTVFIRGAGIAKRATFWRPLMPASLVASYGIGFLIDLFVALVFSLLFPGALHCGWAWLALPVVFLLLTTLLAGLSLITATLYAFSRDVAFFVETGLTFLYWCTPIIYPFDRMPASLRTLALFNPFTPILETSRSILMLGALPNGWILALAFVSPLLILALGLLVFRAHAQRIADQL